MASPIDRFKSAYNAFIGRAPTFKPYYGGSGNRPDRTRHRIQNERSVVNSIYNRIAVDSAQINVKHVRVDEDGDYVSTMSSHLNRLLTLEANIDQTGRGLIQDFVQSMLDEGVVALVPTDLTANPNFTDAYEVLEARVGKIVEWFPKQVRVEVYNEETGKKEQLLVEKRYTPIVENPFYSIMNEPNSTLQRLIRVLNQLDRVNEQNSAGKMDLIVQLPYVVKTEAKQKQAEERRKSIEAQLTGSQYGIAYIDGTEKVIQLNRSVENNLWNQAKELKEDLFNQMGLTMEILNGTADDKTMLNYYSRIIEPILTALVEEIERKWISRTAQSQKQAIRFFRDPFKLVPVGDLAEISDKLTRNEIMTSNEIRVRVGLPPSKDPKADQLINSNLNQPEEESKETIVKTNVVEHSTDLLHYGIPRRSGRYPYGSGERPFQSEKIIKESENGTNSYTIKDSKGTILSEVKTYNFDIDNFDWTLMADVTTQPEHRGRGLATKLINKAYNDIGPEKGMYLFVKKSNSNAIRLYEKLNFNTVKTYSLKDGDYLIMAKGNGDPEQLKRMNFS